MARGKDGKIRLLRGVGLLSACTDKELVKIARLMTEQRADAGEVLVREGRPGREFFLIAEGSVKVSSGGRRRATLGAGEFFGEMSLIDAGPRTATVTAETPMDLYVLDAREFATLLEESPTVMRKILRALAGRLRAAEKDHSH
ncbi:MAG TPA: cyclic nucleotide-binding domain-containing protein [Actinomycetota bacterium]